MQLGGPIVPDDYEEIAHLFNASLQSEGVPVNFDADQIHEELAEPFVRPATDSQTVRLDGRVVGAVFTRHRAPGETGDESVHVMGDVLPDERGKGIGRVLFEWGVQRAHEILATSAGTAPRFIRATCQLANTPAQRMYEHQGLTAVRWFEDLRRPLHDGGLSPEAMANPDGVQVIAWDVARNEEARLVRNASFADHWGSSPDSPAAWNLLVNSHGARHDLSFMAIDGSGSLVGFALNNYYPSDDEVVGARQAWVGTLGTLREWRGKGVGTALIAHSLAAFAADGIEVAAIGVDSDNPSGARRLYSALGFEPWLRQVCHQVAL